MVNFSITSTEVILPLHSPKSKIRIADCNGNHVAKPTECKNDTTNYIEWMITNEELNGLINAYLNGSQKQALTAELGRITDYIRTTKYATRDALKTTVTPITTFQGFQVYQYTEKFYSFEKEISSGVKVRITFKMGDFTLAPHYFVLLPFNHPSVSINNLTGIITSGGLLGSGCFARWTPTIADVIALAMGLAYASDDHKRDIINML